MNPPPTVIFCKVEKKLISKIIFIFDPQTLNIICFVEKNNLFLRVTLLKVIVLSRVLGK